MEKVKGESICGRKFHAITPSINPSVAVSVCGWNVLSDCGANPKFFLSCLPEDLKWCFRKDRITNVLKELNADVVCLQEVDHFRDHFLPELSLANYSGSYLKRSGNKDDGCATFYKNDKFYLLGEEEILFDDLVAKYNSDKLLTHNVAHLCALRAVGDYEKEITILVANCHLHWEPKATKVRLAQGIYLVQRIKKYLKELVTNGLVTETDTVPVFICGDFNDDAQSEVYQQFEKNYNDSYGEYMALHKEEAMYSMWTPTNSATCDFIWFRKDASIAVSEILSLMNASQLKKLLGGEKKFLPCEKIPSDHLPVLATFSIKL